MRLSNPRENFADDLLPGQVKNTHLFWAGFGLYILAYSFAISYEGLFILCQVFQIAGLIMMIAAATTLLRFKLSNGYLRIFYFFYCLWILTLIIRGFSLFLDYSYLKSFLFVSGGLVYFSPLVLLLPKNLTFYRRTFDFILLLGIIYFVFDAFFIRDLLNSDGSGTKSITVVETLAGLSFPTGYLLLTLSYHSKKRQALIIFIVGVSLLFAVIRARRGLILMHVEVISFSYILSLIYFKKKLILVYLTALVFIVGLIYVSGLYKPMDNKIFGFVLQRGDEDTRTGVELYFYDDMKTNDWIAGRGIDGQYFCPNIEPNQQTNYRSVIETGYLQTILKGGLISLGLYLLITLPAIIKGIFQSKNLLSKAAAIWILLGVFDSYPSIVADFSLRYFLIWISIGICYSKSIRNIPEVKMKEYFRSEPDY